MPERDLFGNFERMRREMDELFGDVFGRTSLGPRRGFSPRVDVYYSGDPPRAVVKADIAGMEIEEIGLEIRGRQLLIAGERRAQQAEGRLYQQIEIEHGAFRRTIPLGADVEAAATSATYRDGVLEVSLPLAAPQERTRRVPIAEQRS